VSWALPVEHDSFPQCPDLRASYDEKVFLYLQYGVGDQGHVIGFFKTRNACTDAIND
jgi:hypothetical protein